MSIEALCAAPPEALSLQVGPVAAVGVGHLRIVRHLLVRVRNNNQDSGYVSKIIETAVPHVF